MSSDKDDYLIAPATQVRTQVSGEVPQGIPSVEQAEQGEEARKDAPTAIAIDQLDCTPPAPQEKWP